MNNTFFTKYITVQMLQCKKEILSLHRAIHTYSYIEKKVIINIKSSICIYIYIIILRSETVSAAFLHVMAALRVTVAHIPLRADHT